MRLLTSIFHSQLLLCLFAVTAFSQSLTLPAPTNLQASYTTGSGYVDFYFSEIQGGTGNYFLTLTAGSLPPGVSNISNNALTARSEPAIQGTPTAPGTYTFTLVAHDTTAPTPLSSNPQTISITVITPPVIVAPQTGPFQIQAGHFDQGTVLAVISGGNGGPYSVSLTEGALPTGMSVNVDGANNFNLAGTPLTPGSYTFTIVASDSSSTPVLSNPQVLTVQITEGLLQILPLSLPGITTQTSIAAAASSVALANSPYASGGVPPYRWSILQGTPPPGLTFVPQTPSPFVANSYALTGTPTAAGTYSYSLQVTDSSNNSVNQTFTSSVIAPVSFADPAGATQPAGITVGSDGALWFTQPAIHSVESITTAGTFQHETSLYFPDLTSPNGIPDSIVAGPGPNASLWVTDASNPYIYQVNTNGTLGVHVALQYAGNGTVYNVFPTAITAGNEGGVWFTGYYHSAQGTLGLIGRIDPNNPSSPPQFYPIPAILASNQTQHPLAIVQNPTDNNFWFMDQITLSGNSLPIMLIGRVTPQGQFPAPPSGCHIYTQTQVECAIASPSTGAFVIPVSQGQAGPFMAVGSDGAIWFATGGILGTDGQTANETGRIDMNGAVTLSPTPNNSDSSFPLVLASDLSIWAGTGAGSGSGTIQRITTSGSDTEFVIPGFGPQFNGVAAGPDGALWMTDAKNNRIVQILPNLALNCVGGSSALSLNTAVSITCAALGGKPSRTTPAYTYGLIGTLPTGLTSAQNADGTFTVSGTPTAPGLFTFSATDSSSPPQQATQIFNVAAPVVRITCTLPVTGTAGQPYGGSTASCGVLGGTPPYTYTVSGAGLPPGLTGTPEYQSSNTPPYSFQVSGIINLNASGAYTFGVTAIDSLGTQSTPASATITVAPAPVALSCDPNAEAVIGQAFQLSCFGFRGVGPYTFAATGLPAGLSINPATGVISGTASATGQSPVTITITDSTGATSSTTQNVSLTVVNQPLTITCDFSPRAQVGTPYTAACTPAGGAPPYTYAPSGTPPAGFALSGNAVSGTPTTPGPYSFTLSVLDSAGGAAKQIVNLFVHPTALSILTTTLPVPNISLPYAVTPLVEGGTPPYTFSLAAGTLTGTGLSLNPNTGTLSGAPVAGTYSFTLQVTDSTTATATQAYSGSISSNTLNVSTSSFTLAPSVNLGGVNGLITAPDGNLWFTALDQVGGNLIGSISATGTTVNTTPASNALTQLSNAAGGDITVGPDGQLWIAQRDGNAVAEQSTTLTQPPLTYLPSANSNPSQIVTAFDGALWFTEVASNKIAHVDPAGNLVELAIPTASSQPAGIAVASDGSIWFTEQAANQIGSMSEDGSVKHEFAIPTAASQPTSITLGADNALWFTESAKGQIGRVDLTGHFSEFPTGAANSSPQAITAGPDGALYFTDRAANQIGRITVAGGVANVAAPDSISGLSGIAVGPDGAIWFAESNLSKVGRLSLVQSLTISCTLPPNPFPARSAFSGTCTASEGTAPYTYGFDPASTPPPGIAIDPNTGVLSGTLTTAGTFPFDVLVKDSSSPALIAKSSSYTVVVSPVPLSATCTTPTALWYTPYTGGSCTGVNGTPPYTYVLTNGALPAGLTLNPTSGTLTGIPTAVGTFGFTVQVTDSSSPAMVATAGNSSVTVAYGSRTPGNGPLLSLSALPATETPGVNLSGITLTANAPLTQALSGTATLSFTSGSANTNTTPAAYVDPALQFVDSTGNGLGTTYNFTFQPGTTLINLPTINPGTVTGQVNLVVSTTLPQAGAAFSISASPAIVDSGSVQFTNVTSTGFDVEFVGIEPERQAQNATITFNSASGSQILGQQTFNFDVGQVSDQWFASASGLSYGGRFSLTFPFTLSGPISAIASATVTLDGSSPVTGNR